MKATALNSVQQTLGNNLDGCKSVSLRLNKLSPEFVKDDKKQEIENICKVFNDNTRDLQMPDMHFPNEVSVYAKLQSRLIVNQAGGIIENAGLCLHRFFGYPMIPGSAVKGAAHHVAWCEWKEIPEESKEERLAHVKKMASVFGYPLNDGDIENFIEEMAKEEFKDYALSGKEIVITIPQGLLVSEESVTLDGASASDTELTDSELRIRITENSGTVQFSASPTAYGLIVSSASFCFNYAGVSYREFAGSITTTVEYVTIEVPTTTATQSILVQGVTVPGASVTVYDGEWVIGRATAYESGRWSALVELSGNDADALHLISASVTVDGETKTTAQYEVLWADNLTNIKNLHIFICHYSNNRQRFGFVFFP
mgnify:CR=1 FL=1